MNHDVWRSKHTSAIRSKERVCFAAFSRNGLMMLLWVEKK